MKCGRASLALLVVQLGLCAETLAMNASDRAGVIPVLSLVSAGRAEEKKVDPGAEGKRDSEAAAIYAQEKGLARSSDPLPRRRNSHPNSRIVKKTSALSASRKSWENSAHYDRNEVPENQTLIIRYFNGRSDEENKRAYDEELKNFDATRIVIRDYDRRIAMAREKNDTAVFCVLTEFFDYYSFNFRTPLHYVQTAYVSFVEGAQGSSLEEILKTKSDINLEAIFFSVGLQLGNSYRLYYDDNLRLIHPDPNLGNFIFDISNNHLNWIDHNGITTVVRDQARFLKNHELNVSFFTRDMPNLARSFVVKANRERSDVDHAVKIVRAHQAIFDGYRTAVSGYGEAEITIDFVFTENPSSNQPLDYLSLEMFKTTVMDIEGAYLEEYAEPIDLYGDYQRNAGGYAR